MTVGLSLSFCVGDILRKKYLASEVDHIVSNTRFASIKEAFDYYCESYWYDFSENDVLAVLMEIWPKLIQPRLENPRYSHNVAQGHWIEAADLADAIRIVSARRPYY
jgi:hypothetical protein